MDRVLIYTEAPRDDLWMHFRRFEVVDWVNTRIRNVDGHSPGEVVGHCVRQAREYFRSARAAPLITRPVLLYYGMVSLGKLLLLLDEKEPLSIDEIEAVERRGHGLKQVDPEPLDAGMYRLEDARVEVISQRKGGRIVGLGTFPELAHRVSPGGGTAWLGKSFPLLDLLRAIPQLDVPLRQAFGDQQGYSGLEVSPALFADGTAALRVPVGSPPGATPRDPGALMERVPYIDWEQHTVVPGDPSFSLMIRCAPDDVFGLAVREELTGHGYSLPPVLSGERFDSLVAQYMVMYALSIVARYKPHRWADILEGHRSPLLPVVEKLMAVSERWWPNLILNRLTGTEVTFAAPTYWG